jgi:hypothetical protein
MRTSIFLVVGLLVVATAASAAMFSDDPAAFAPGDDSDDARANYALFYHAGMSGWASVWTFSADAYAGTYFDPLDNLGSDIHEAYQVTRIACGWKNDSGGELEVNFYICSDDDGQPDFGSPLATVPLTIHDTGDYWEQFNITVDPAVPFNCGELFWVVSDVFANNPKPCSDTEDELDDSDPQYHSYTSTDGFLWELFGKDWKHTVYAESAESTNSIAPVSFGNIKAYYE